MSVVRTKKSKEKPYVTIDTTALNDPRLSFRAKGLHTYLMSKPDGWHVYIEQLEKSSPTEGRDAIRTALTELETAGYLQKERLRGEKGRMVGWDTTVYETPALAIAEQHDKAQHETIGLRESVQPKSVQPKSVQPKSVQPKSVQPKSANPQLVSIDYKQVLKEVNLEDSKPPVSPDGETSPTLTPEDLATLYNAETPESHPKVKVLSPARKAKALAYLKMFPAHDWWRGVFQAIAASPFLRGEKVNNGHASFRADFDWLLSKGKDGTENCVKVADGRYDETPMERAVQTLGEKGARTARASLELIQEMADDDQHRPFAFLSGPRRDGSVL